MAPAAVFLCNSPKYFFPLSFFQSRPPILDTLTMAQSTQLSREGVAQVAVRILMAWHSGETAGLSRELEYARRLAAQAPHSSTLEMETMEVLSGAVESLRHSCGQHAGAVRLLEHLAKAPACS